MLKHDRADSQDGKCSSHGEPILYGSGILMSFSVHRIHEEDELSYLEASLCGCCRLCVKERLLALTESFVESLDKNE